MVAVFGIFAILPDLELKQAGVGLASAILDRRDDRARRAPAGGDGAARRAQLVPARGRSASCRGWSTSGCRRCRAARRPSTGRGRSRMTSVAIGLPARALREPLSLRTWRETRLRRLVAPARRLLVHRHVHAPGDERGTARHADWPAPPGPHPVPRALRRGVRALVGEAPPVGRRPRAAGPAGGAERLLAAPAGERDRPAAALARVRLPVLLLPQGIALFVVAVVLWSIAFGGDRGPAGRPVPVRGQPRPVRQRQRRRHAARVGRPGRRAGCSPCS